MFGSWFYHKRVRTAVSVFGSLFNNIYVLRQNSAGETISQVKVPLSYAPKRSFIERLNEMKDGEQSERRVAIKLPRMSFEITSMAYSPERQLPKTNSFSTALSGSVNKRNEFYTSVPYDISFDVNVYAKSQDDALQMVEQILPYFNPQYTVSVKPFGTQYPEIKEDVPIALTGVSFSDDFEGSIGDRRTIIYTLTFNMKIAFYGPINSSSIVRTVNNNIYTLGDSDYGFNLAYLDSAQ